MMLVGCFFVLYGGLGVVLFSEKGMVLEKLMGLTLLVVFILWLINFLWAKIFTMETYVLPKKSNLIGFIATVLFTVDSNGGMIKLDLGLPKAAIYSAYPRNPNESYPPGTKVVIVGWKGSFAIVKRID